MQLKAALIAHKRINIWIKLDVQYVSTVHTAFHDLLIWLLEADTAAIDANLLPFMVLLNTTYVSNSKHIAAR